MGLPKKAKGRSKKKCKAGKEKDGKLKEPATPQITVRIVRTPTT